MAVSRITVLVENTTSRRDLLPEQDHYDCTAAPFSKDQAFEHPDDLTEDHGGYDKLLHPVCRQVPAVGEWSDRLAQGFLISAGP